MKRFELKTFNNFFSKDLKTRNDFFKICFINVKRIRMNRQYILEKEKFFSLIRNFKFIVFYNIQIFLNFDRKIRVNVYH